MAWPPASPRRRAPSPRPDAGAPRRADRGVPHAVPTPPSSERPEPRVRPGRLRGCQPWPSRRHGSLRDGGAARVTSESKCRQPLPLCPVVAAPWRGERRDVPAGRDPAKDGGVPSLSHAHRSLRPGRRDRVFLRGRPNGTSCQSAAAAGSQQRPTTR